MEEDDRVVYAANNKLRCRASTARLGLAIITGTAKTPPFPGSQTPCYEVSEIISFLIRRTRENDNDQRLIDPACTILYQAY